MQQADFIESTRTTMRKYFIVFFLVTTAIAYYYIISDVLTEITTNIATSQFDKLLIMGVFYA